MSLRWVGEAITGTTAFGFGRIRVSRRGSGAHFGPAGKTLTLVGKNHAVDRPVRGASQGDASDARAPGARDMHRGYRRSPHLVLPLQENETHALVKEGRRSGGVVLEEDRCGRAATIHEYGPIRNLK